MTATFGGFVPPALWQPRYPCAITDVEIGNPSSLAIQLSNIESITYSLLCQI